MGKEMSDLLFFLAPSRSKSTVDFNATSQRNKERCVILQHNTLFAENITVKGVRNAAGGGKHIKAVWEPI